MTFQLQVIEELTSSALNHILLSKLNGVISLQVSANPVAKLKSSYLRDELLV